MKHATVRGNPLLQLSNAVTTAARWKSCCCCCEWQLGASFACGKINLNKFLCISLFEHTIPLPPPTFSLPLALFSCRRMTKVDNISQAAEQQQQLQQEQKPEDFQKLASQENAPKSMQHPQLICDIWSVTCLSTTGFLLWSASRSITSTGQKVRVGPHLTDKQTSSIRHVDPVYASCFFYIALPCFVHHLLLLRSSSLCWSVFLGFAFVCRLFTATVVLPHPWPFFCVLFGVFVMPFALLCNASQCCAKCVCVCCSICRLLSCPTPLCLCSKATTCALHSPTGSFQSAKESIKECKARESSRS